MTGRVVSTKLKNTATVLISRIAMHSLYKKTFVRTKRYLVEDLIGVKDGDIVEIIKCKPISKNKHWKIKKVIGQDLAEIVEAQQKKAAAEVIADVMPVEKEGDRVQGVGVSEEIIKEEKKKESKRKEKLVPKP